MWHRNETVTETYATSDSQNAWAMIGERGWLQVAPKEADGVTNTFIVLNAAKAHGKTVDVFIVSNQITRATLK